MASMNEPSLRDVYSSVAEELLKLRNDYEANILDTAREKQDVTLDRVRAITQASNLIREKYTLFKEDAEGRFKRRPWSDAAQIIIKSSKTKYFFAVPGLLDDVACIIRGLPPEPLLIQDQEDCWDWGAE